MSTCMVCGVDFVGAATGRPRRFCGGACRVKAHRDRRRSPAIVAELRAELDPIPVELRRLPRWVRHREKRPIAIGGWAVSVHDELAWASYGEVVGCDKGDGFGFVLNGDGIVCVDLDDCVTDGVVDAEAADFVAGIGETYSEFSPSGRGLHVWGYGSLDKGRRFTAGNLKVEVYPAGRFITVTGRPYRKSKLDVLYLDWALQR
jgi:primase-polymerase (primpol)-like protein